MAKRTKLWVVGALLLIVGGTVIASNMGFKFVPNIPAGDNGIVYSLSLPLNNNYTDAQSLIADLRTNCPNVEYVQRVVPTGTGGSRRTWPGVGQGGTLQGNFNVASLKSEGYFLKLCGTGANCTGNAVACNTAVVVGSHDPAYGYSFTAAVTGDYPSGRVNKTNLVSIPYHTTATNANDLWVSLGTGINTFVTSYSGKGGKTIRSWPGVGNGGTLLGNFPVVIGQSYIVVVPSATTWTPAHY